MLHHVSLAVSDLRDAGAFYDAALGALGYRRVFEDPTAIGYGVEDGEDKLCLKLRLPHCLCGSIPQRGCKLPRASAGIGRHR